MKAFNLPAALIILTTLYSSTSHAQPSNATERQQRDLSRLIELYSHARETRDTVLLKSILTDDIDQLVSTGEWRKGIRAATDGMVSSSTRAPGKRSLTVHSIKLLSENCALIDCQYETINTDGTTRRMWSTFVAISTSGSWKISAIRNMLPSNR